MWISTLYVKETYTVSADTWTIESYEIDIGIEHYQTNKISWEMAKVRNCHALSSIRNDELSSLAKLGDTKRRVGRENVEIVSQGPSIKVSAVRDGCLVHWAMPWPHWGLRKDSSEMQQKLPESTYVVKPAIAFSVHTLDTVWPVVDQYLLSEHLFTKVIRKFHC